MKKLLGCLGIGAGLSVAHRYSKHILALSSPYPIVQNVAKNSFLFHFSIANASPIFLVLAINLFKWLIFGSLTAQEVSMLRKKFSYTLWEFFLSLVVLKTFESKKFNKALVFKFACLFSCVLLLKFFHYLCVYRVSNVFQGSGSRSADKKHAATELDPKGGSIFSTDDSRDRIDSTAIDQEILEEFDDLSTYSNPNDYIFDNIYLASSNSPLALENNQRVTGKLYCKTNALTHFRFAMGILMLNVIDVVLIIKFKHEIYNNNNNIMLSLFGFEIINFYPLIILTSYNYILNYFEYRSDHSLFKKFLSNLEQDLMLTSLSPSSTIKKNYNKLVTQKNKNLIYKKKYLIIFKFFINNLKFLNQIIFSILFMQYYTFPLHILSYSYISLRIFIIKLRLLISLKKFEMKYNRAQSALRDPFEAKNVEGGLSSIKESCCSICRNDFMMLESGPSKQENIDENVKMLACQHCFHHDCIVSWLMKSSNCPICQTQAL